MGSFDRDDGERAGDHVDRIEQDATERDEDETMIDAGMATGLIEKLLDVGIDGKGRFDSAQHVADTALAEHPEPGAAIDKISSQHLRLAAAGGFVTGLGGLVTMTVALPANVVGFYLLATRAVAAIASVRGYDIRRPEVRSAVLLALVGADADDLLKKAGLSGGGRLANFAVERLPGPVLMAVNKGVGFRLMTQVGKKTLARFGKAVPVLGGVVGAGLDTYLLKRILDHAKHEFPPKTHVLTR
ncbi:MAG TPA: EcsC family protein [Segeticoccus sp.]|uniref:EcsC family protein n=1 Tax=Segeticoccus sp. TaxID=2706531 RepID=UPI002D7E9F15|nr:EcsC family protein [Segeticoccus sp.]HET8602081.1 EcsC family protein [Segeticoccus sp.]